MRLVRTDSLGPIGLVELEGGRANAMSLEFVTRLEALAAEVLASDASAVVLTGYQRFFSAGLDLPSLLGLERDALRTFMTRWQQAMLAWFDLPLPVVAAINGHAIAGGCVLGLMADVRVMVDAGAKIGLSEAQLGIGLPSVVTEALRLVVPPAALPALALEGRLVTPAEALAFGLVDAVAPADQVVPQALARARTLGAQPRPATGHIKTQLRRGAREAIARESGFEGWLDSWFSAPAQRLLSEAVARLKK